MMVLGAAAAAVGPAPSRYARLATALAGPVSIVALVVVVLHDVVFGGMVSDRNPDLLAFWMPNQCFLGQELAAGRIPYWNPHALGGTPFAADPQSGWMYLPMMALGLLSCDVALRALVVFFPILAGLGGYAFLRGEGASRAAATATGLTLAGVTAGSALAVTLTFVGFVAWTPWLLAAASRSLRARLWSGRLVWAALAALVWGQVAAAHISNGLVMATTLLGLFWIYRATVEVRAGRATPPALLLLTLVGALLLVAVNLAYLLPRVLYLQRSTIGLGYEGLFELRNQLWDLPPAQPPVVRVTEPQWVLRVSTSPGAYLAALPLALSFAGLFVRRWRSLALVLSLYSVAFYALGVRHVADLLQPLVGDGFLGDFYGHAPARFGYAPIVGLCLLAGIGIEAWRGEPSMRRRALMLAPGLVLWALLPLLAGAEPARLWLLAAGLVIGLPLLLLARRRPVAWALLVLVLAVELGANALYGQSRTWDRADHGLSDPRIVGVEPLPEPAVDPAEFATELPVLGGLERPPQERWLTLDPSLQVLGRQIVHGLNEAQGYNPVQLRRYWIYTRAIERRGVDGRPRMTIFRALPDRGALDLLHVRYVATAGVPPAEGFERITAGDGWTVWESARPSPPASSFASYTLLQSPDEALSFVTDRGFRPHRDLVVERRGVSAIVSHTPARDVELQWLDPSTVEVTVDADMHRYLLVRIPYDDYWTAKIDGRSAEVFPADYFLQAVSLDEGDRVVRLSYRDPWVVWGLWGSALSLATVIAVGALLRRRERRTRVHPRPREAAISTAAAPGPHTHHDDDA